MALALTFPTVITVNVLGEPDNGVIAAGYLGSFFVAGAYLAVTCMTSAMTRNQMVAFILAARDIQAHLHRRFQLRQDLPRARARRGS